MRPSPPRGGLFFMRGIKKVADHVRREGECIVAGRRKEEVELVGVEPTSEQGNRTLSTRLFQTSFSSDGKTWTTNRRLIL